MWVYKLVRSSCGIGWNYFLSFRGQIFMRCLFKFTIIWVVLLQSHRYIHPKTKVKWRAHDNYWTNNITNLCTITQTHTRIIAFISIPFPDDTKLFMFYATALTRILFRKNNIQHWFKRKKNNENWIKKSNDAHNTNWHRWKKCFDFLCVGATNTFAYHTTINSKIAFFLMFFFFLPVTSN